MTATIKYLGDLECELTHTRSGVKIKNDAPVDNNGKGSAFSPTDLVATATGSCMLTTMGIVAQRNNWNIIGASAEVEKIMASEPRRIGGINIKIHFPQTGLGDKEKKTLENTALTCPVMQSLHPDIKKNIEFTW
jgi:putative redox protein